MLLLILPIAFISFLPIGIAVYFIFSKKHKDEASAGYRAWMD